MSQGLGFKVLGRGSRLMGKWSGVRVLGPSPRRGCCTRAPLRTLRPGVPSSASPLGRVKRCWATNLTFGVKSLALGGV